tara:strand:+ start:136 stop:519 length:384 start_codon:yes stop_codon:yes gene_type:complete
MNNFKIIFHILNVLFLIFYFYPGSIIGIVFYGNINYQPQLINDFVISSNHFFIFIIISYFGLLAYYEIKKKIILFYLIFISIFTEILHLLIPLRAFQFSDLFGNILGVILTIFLFLFFKNLVKKNND